MKLRTTTLSAALALAISAGGPALAQDAPAPAPVLPPAGTQQPADPAVTPGAADQAAPAPAEAVTEAEASADAPGDAAAPAEATPSEPEVGATQSSEPTQVPGAADQTPMEAPAAPSVTPDTAAEPATDPAADTAADPDATDPGSTPSAEAGAEPAPAETPAEEAAAPEAPADAPAEEPAAEADTGTAEPEAAGEPAADAVQVTEGEESAVPAETTGTVVAVEGHDDIEGAHGEDEAAGDGHGAAHIDDVAFSFEGPFGKYDQFQLQRGLQVYTEVCAACHGLKYVPIRTLHDDGGPGLPENQVRAYAANLTPILDPETGEERPRVPTDHFPTVVGDGMGPDLSLLAKARAAFHGPYGTGINQLLKGIGGPEYIHAVLTQYTGEEIEQAGTVLYENTAFPGGYISMPAPLSEDLVTYEDGTPVTVEQMSLDVSAFLMWAAEPKLSDRKQVGFVAVLFLIVLTSLLYLANKRLWAPHKGKPRTR